MVVSVRKPTSMNGTIDYLESSSPTDHLKMGASIGELRRIYLIADAFRGEVEKFWGDAAIPANNQLRYAGDHLLKGLSNEGVPSAQSVAAALSHCKRAGYEAAESGILFAFEKIAVFKGEYRYVSKTGILPQFMDHLVAAD